MQSLFPKSSLLAVGASVFLAAAAVAQDHKPDTKPDSKPAATAPTSQPAVRKDLPDAKSLIQANVDAMGGKKAWDAVESVALKATMNTPMGDFNLDMTSAKPGKFLMKQSSPMGEATAGSDGVVAWRNMAMMGGYSLLTDEQAAQTAEQANFYHVVLSMEDDFKTKETVDKTDFNGEPCYKVMLTGGKEGDAVAYFSVAKKLIQGVEITPQDAMPATKLVFDEWKEKGPLKVYTKMMVDQAGVAITLTVTEVEFNKVDPKVFELPAEVKELVKKREAPASKPAQTKPAAPAPGGAGH